MNHTSFTGYNSAYLDRRVIERPIEKVHRYVGKTNDIPEPAHTPKKEEMFDVDALDCWICPRLPDDAKQDKITISGQ